MKQDWKKWLGEYWPLAGAVVAVAIVVGTRTVFPAFIRSDGPTIFDTAWRWSQGLGFTSSAFVEHPQDLAAEPHYPPMTWWAPGASLTMGLLLKAGLGQEAAYRVFMTAAVVVGWLGWLVVARRFALDFLRRHWWAGVIFCLLPLHFTPMRDPDEMAGWAVLPWIAACVPGVLGARWAWAALAAGAVCAAGVFYRYSTVQYVAAAVVAVALLPAGWRRRLAAAVLVAGPPAGVWLGMRMVLGRAAEYLDHERGGVWDVARLALEAVGHAGIMPLLGMVTPVVPRDLFQRLEAFSDAQTHLGWVAVVVWAALGVALLRLYLACRRSAPERAAAYAFLMLMLLSLPVFFVLTSVKTNNAYLFTKNVNYYNLTAVGWPMLAAIGLAMVNYRGRFGTIALGALALYLALFSVTPLYAKRSTARFNIVGYHFSPKKFAGERISFLAHSVKDLRLDVLEGQPPGIVFVDDPDNFAPIHSATGHSFRPLPYWTQWREMTASRPVTVYVVVREGREPQPPSLMTATREGRELARPIPELARLPGWRKLEGEIWQSGNRLFVYRADIPAGWRGAELFEQHEDAQPGLAPPGE